MAIFDGNTIRTTVEMEFLASSVSQNVWHCSYNGPTVSVDQQAVDDIMFFLETALYRIIDIDISEDISWVRYSNFNVTLGTPLPDAVPVDPLVGASSGNSLPSQTAALMSFPTAVSRSIGRKYMPVYTESTTLGGGELIVTSQARLGGAALVLITPFTIEGGSGQMGNSFAGGTSFAPWVSGRFDALFRTQRRRVPGVGI